MTTPEVPPSETAREPTAPHPREDEPLWALTLGDVQTVALENLGRFLTEAEVTAVVDNFRAALNWTFYVANSIQASQERGKVGPAVEDEDVSTPHLPEPEEGPLPEPVVSGDAVLTSFLVYYALGGLMLVHATDAKEASESAFASLHRLIGRMETDGVTPSEASQVRLGDLDVSIESVEATEFPHDELVGLQPGSSMRDVQPTEVGVSP